MGSYYKRLRLVLNTIMFPIHFYLKSNLINDQFTMKHIKLLFSLRSKSYPAKTNFTKMHRGNLRCRCGCLQAETQTHIFENSEVLKSKVNSESKSSINQIFESVIDQKKSILFFEKLMTNGRKCVTKSYLEDWKPGPQHRLNLAIVDWKILHTGEIESLDCYCLSFMYGCCVSEGV